VGLGSSRSGLHLPVVADVHPHRWAPPRAFLRTAYLIFMGEQLYWLPGGRLVPIHVDTEAKVGPGYGLSTNR
jgi:hypothetical protein